MSTFEQILDMDDDEEEKEFSKGIVFGFLEQAEQTFDKMDTSMYPDLPCPAFIDHTAKPASAFLAKTRTSPNFLRWATSSRDPLPPWDSTRSRTSASASSTLAPRRTRPAPKTSPTRNTV
jgi:hypothetical protein